VKQREAAAGVMVLVGLVAVTASLWVMRANRNAPSSMQASDLDGARAAFESNIAAIQHRNAEAYLSSYLQSPALTILSDSFAQGYEGFAAARRASTDWPDTLVASEPKLVWLAPGMVYGAYHYVRVQGHDTTRGWSERIVTKTRDGWKMAVTTAFQQKE
jgi:hypothetical protein